MQINCSNHIKSNQEKFKRSCKMQMQKHKNCNGQTDRQTCGIIIFFFAICLTMTIRINANAYLIVFVWCKSIFFVLPSSHGFANFQKNVCMSSCSMDGWMDGLMDLKRQECSQFSFLFISLRVTLKLTLLLFDLIWAMVTTQYLHLPSQFMRRFACCASWESKSSR